MTSQNEQLKAAYDQAAMNASSLAQEVAEKIHDMPAPGTDGIDWPKVGTLNHVANVLKELNEFLASALTRQ